MRVYRAIGRKVAEGEDWDAKIRFIDFSVMQVLKQLINQLTINKWYKIVEPRHLSYNDAAYDYIIFTDASVAGWGALVCETHNKKTYAFQRRWVNHLDVDISRKHSLAIKQVKRIYGDVNVDDNMWMSYGKYSAHDEVEGYIKRYLSTND